MDITQSAPGTDQYPSDLHILEVSGAPWFIENDALYQAMLTLPEKHLIALVMHFWCNRKDSEIALRFNRTERTIRSWRKTSLMQFQKHMILTKVQQTTKEE